MLRFSWMLRYAPQLNHHELLKLIRELDEIAYGSILLTVHSKAADYLPIVSRILDEDFKIKYMLAIRPYLLSPQFFMMLISGMNTIAKNKIMINWVHGALGPQENFNAILNMPENMNNPHVKRNYLENFINSLSKADMFVPTPIPESIVSGGNPETIKMASRLGMHLGTGYDAFLNNHNVSSQYDFKKIFLQVSLLIRDTDEEALKVKNEKQIDSINLIYGSPETVKKELIRIYSLGVTDFLVSQSYYVEGEMKKERERIHNLILSMREGGLAQ